LFDASLCFLAGTSLRLSLCRNASFLLGPALPLRCGACFFFRAALRFFCLTSLPFSLCRNAGLFLRAAASRAHDDPHVRGCERKTNRADNE
jgi:hypothetical protein